jgi:serine/threonine protein kinase
MVMEAFETDLHKYLFARVPAETFAKSVIHQVGQGLAYLHGHARIVHMDVKPGNVLLQATCCRAALADFGHSETIGVDRGRYGRYVTANYRPPEHWQRRAPCVGAELFQPHVDAWSFGCLVWEATSRVALGDGQPCVPPEHLFSGRSSSEVQASSPVSYTGAALGGGVLLPSYDKI